MCDQVCLLENIKTLASNYSKKFTSEELREKVNLFYKFINKYTNQHVTHAVNELIDEGTTKHFPEVADLKRYLNLKVIEDKPKFCDICEFTGYYTLWHLKDTLKRYYAFAYACKCNTVKHGMAIIDQNAIPVRAHNPFPPTDKRHAEFNLRKLEND